MAICSNKKQILAEKVLKDLNLLHFFQIVVGGDTFPTCKPHPQPLIESLTILSCLPKNAVMIGDNITDMEAGRKARVKTIAFTPHDHQQDHNLTTIADCVMTSWRQLPAILTMLFPNHFHLSTSNHA